jgi:dUTP pyrophosphatase
VTESIEVLFTGTLPVYAHPGDAGADLVAAEDVVLAPGERATVPTGLKIALPRGYVGFTIVNSPGTVDAGYRGEIRVTLLNTDPRESYAIAAGDRIAQLIVMALPAVRFVEVQRLPGSERGEGGFGSTGYGSAQSATGATSS